MNSLENGGHKCVGGIGKMWLGEFGETRGKSIEFEKGKELPKLREKGKFSASGMENR
jgi:hypothetical protein